MDYQQGMGTETRSLYILEVPCNAKCIEGQLLHGSRKQ